MLDFFRSHRRLMQLLLLVLIFPSFVFFGIEGYSRFLGNSQALAEVDGKPIEQAEFDAVQRQQDEQLRRALGERVPPWTPERRRALLDNMIGQRVLGNEINRAHLTVSDDAVRTYILQSPLVAPLRNADDTVNVDAYKLRLAQQGLTPEQYDQQVRFSLSADRLVNIVSGSAIVARSQAELLIAASEQEREVQEKVLSAADFAKDVNPTDAELNAYYAANKQTSFTRPEETRIEYIEFSAAHLEKDVVVTDAMLRQAYEANVAHARVGEQRRASHILLAVDKNATAAERAEVRSKAEKLLVTLRAQPEKFAEIARQESNDPGSATQGGDLGFFGRGSMVKPFEDAVYNLREGQLSDIVESDFGFHLIKLAAIKEARIKSFDEMKAELTNKLKQELVSKRFNELADSFTNLVYDQYASLQPAADKFKLPIRSANYIGRHHNPVPGESNLLNNEKLLSALFSDDVLKNKRNTEAVLLAPQTLVAARIVAHSPAAVMPFSDVRNQVRAKLVADMAANLAKQEGKKLMQLGSNAEMGVAHWVGRGQPGTLSPKALAAIFRADVSKLPMTVGVDLGKDGYALYRITQVKSAAVPTEARLRQLEASLSSERGNQDYRAYIEAARARAKVKFNLPVGGEVAAAPPKS